MKCVKCSEEIPQKRLDAIKTNVCVKCSDVEVVVGFTVWDRKTPELMILSSDEAIRAKKLERLDGRMERL